MADPTIASLGRFSSQMLSYLGTQRTVQNVDGTYSNVFKYATGPTTFVEPDSYQQATLGYGVVGNFSPDDYNATVAFFQSKGTTQVYSDTMTSLAIDIAALMQMSPQAFLESTTSAGQFQLTDQAYAIFNILRDPGHQVGTATPTINSQSLQARQIRG